MNKNWECLCCHEVEAVEYFELLGMRYVNMNAVTQSLKLQTAVLQLYIIWTTAQFLEHVIVFQRQI